MPPLDWAFREFDLERIHARADVENYQSSRVMEKLGMQREGIARGSGPSAYDPNARGGYGYILHFETGVEAKLCRAVLRASGYPGLL